MDAIERARAYVAKCPPAIAGSRGHNQTFSVACALVHGFALSEGEAWPLLQDYNRTCQPPWSEKDLWHKLKTAPNAPHEKPRGHLIGLVQRTIRHTFGGSLSESRPAPTTTTAIQGEPSKPSQAGVYEIGEGSPIPPPIADGCRTLLQSVFAEGEGISIAREVLREETDDAGQLKTRGVPKDGGLVLSREDWIAKLTEKDGDPNKIWSSSDRTGCFIRVNPVKLDGSGLDKDVTSYRHALVEFDKISLEKQWALIKASNLPCSAVLHSGKRSLHAWVRVDAANLQEFKDRVKFVWEHFAGYQIDQANKNPSRFSRLPGMVRGEGRQELLCLRSGARSFDDWKAEVSDTFPKITDVQSLVADQVTAPAEIVGGLLHKGSKLVIGGASKSFKTWTLLDLALSVAYGLPWLSMETTKGRVLYLNLEIQPYFFTQRIKKVSEAKSIALGRGTLDVWNLRGHDADLLKMIPKILKHCSAYSLIVADPIYKLYGKDIDENSAGDVATLCRMFDYLTVQTGAAIAFGAHFAKGNASGKDTRDRISGSGVFVRDPDSLLTLTQHETESAFVVESTLRDFKPMDPFCVKWEFPLMRRDGTLDPAKLKQPTGGKKNTYKVAKEEKKEGRPAIPRDYASILPTLKLAGPAGRTDLCALLAKKLGCSASTVRQEFAEHIKPLLTADDETGGWLIGLTPPPEESQKG